MTSPFGIFTSFALNTGGRVCMVDHTDPNNFAGSFCVVIAFGSTDYRTSALLIIKIGDTEYRFELPAGIPIYFPSALFLHSNSEIVGSEGYRGSAVYWLAGSVARWYLLDGRAVGQLSAEEKACWGSKQAVHERAQQILSLYPKLEPSSSSS